MILILGFVISLGLWVVADGEDTRIIKLHNALFRLVLRYMIFDHVVQIQNYIEVWEVPNV